MSLTQSQFIRLFPGVLLSELMPSPAMLSSTGTPRSSLYAALASDCGNFEIGSPARGATAAHAPSAMGSMAAPPPRAKQTESRGSLLRPASAAPTAPGTDGALRALLGSGLF